MLGEETPCQRLENEGGDYASILIDVDTFGIVLGIVLAIGALLAVVPQHVKLCMKRTSVGISYWWLFLANIQQFTSATNAVMLKFPQLQACGEVGFAKCFPSILALFQLCGIWIVTFPIFIEFLIWFPRGSGIIKNGDREFKRAVAVFVTLVVVLLILIGTIVGLIHFNGPCGTMTVTFAYATGLFSTVVNFMQWAPQIWKTWRAKRVGSLSIVMLAIGAPGNAIVLCFLVFISKETVTTWLANAASAVQQGFLLGLALYYNHKEKKAGGLDKYYQYDVPIDDFSDDEHDPSAPLKVSGISLNLRTDENDAHGRGGRDPGGLPPAADSDSDDDLVMGGGRGGGSETERDRYR